MLTELRCPLEVEVTGKGRGHVFAIIDYGPEADLLFVTICANGEIWCARPKDIRVAPNWSLGRLNHDENTEARAKGAEGVCGQAIQQGGNVVRRDHESRALILTQQGWKTL